MIEILRTLTATQKAAYELICSIGVFHAEGPKVKTYRSLARLGLIKHNTESQRRHEYVLSGDAPKRPKKIKIPKVSQVVKNIIAAPEVVINTTSAPKPWVIIKETIEEKERPKFTRPRADHTNLSREDHIAKWLAVPVEPGVKGMVKVKCLNDSQMLYIMANFENKTAQQMAEHLQVEKYAVKLFCQANNIEPYVGTQKKKSYKGWRVIPHERQLRMNKVGYNQKKAS